MAEDTVLTDADAQQYLTSLRETYLRTVDSYLKEEERGLLARYRYINNAVIFYISTTFGAGYEYTSTAEYEIKVVRSHLRVEDLITSAPRDVRRWGARGCGVLMSVGARWHVENLHFVDSYPFRLHDEQSSLRIINLTVEGLGWWKKDIRFAEVYGSNAPSKWALDKAMERAKDEIIVALLDTKRARDNKVTLEEYLRTLKKKTV